MRKTTFYIDTLGCKVNQYESQVMRENFTENGFIEAESKDKADIRIINTCTVTSTSDSKSFRLIRNAVKINKCVVVTGCLVEDNNLDLSEFSGVHFIIKNKDKYRLPEIIKGSQGSYITKVTGFKGRTRIFVKVQDGCNNLCSYCKVRIVRGRSRSKPLREILDECAGLIKNGSKEIVLTGICLGSYGRDLSKRLTLSVLLSEVCRIEGDWRLRLSSIEPKDIKEDLIRQLRTQDRLCKHLHIPFQSGDSNILKKMQRPYSRSDYSGIVNRLKEAVPDIAISTDIMVGFPGETEGNFQNTIDFIKEVRPMRMHIFPFSRRSGTAAYRFKDNVTDAVKKKRENILSSLAGELSRGFISEFNDKTVQVLVEGRKSYSAYLQGYTDRYIKVYIDGPDRLKGCFVNCRLSLTPPFCFHENKRAGLTNHIPYGILIPHLICSPF